MGIYLSRLGHRHVARRAAGLAACFVLAVMTVQMAPPAAIAKAPTTKTPPTAPTMASLLAKMAPTEVNSLRSATSDTYDNHDGTFTRKIAADRVNYKDSSGAWQRIDPSLTASTSGNYTMASKANDTGLVVSDKQAGNSLARLKVGSHLVSLRVPGYADASASPLHPGSKPSGSGSKGPWSDPVRTIGASGGVVIPGSGNDGPVFLNPTTDGFEFGAVLTSANSSTTYSYALDTGGLTAVLDPDGVTVDLVDTSASGKVAGAPLALQIQNPDVVDAAGLGSTETDVSTYLVQPGDPYYPVGVSSAAVASLKRSEVLIVYKINPAWLTAAGRTYPVTFDPTVTTCLGGSTCLKNGYYDTNIDQGKGGTWSGAGLIRAGLDGRGNGLGLIRTMLIFGHANLVPTVGPFGSGVQVTSASLWVNEVNNYGSGSMGFVPGRITQPWTVNTASWSASSGAAVMSPSDVGWSGCGHGTGFNCGLAMPVTDIVSSWYTANTAVQKADYGFMLESYNEAKPEIDATSGTTGTNANYFPQLSFTYTVPSLTVNGTPGAWTNSRNLSWNYSADGGSAQTGSYVELSTSSSFASLVWNSGAISGSGTSTAIPGTVNLTDGQTYYWRVVVTDGAAVSAPSAPGSFKWDSTAPTFGAGNFTAPVASQTDVASTPFTFRWNAATDPASRVASYSYQLISAQVTIPNTCPTAPFWNPVSGASGTVPATTLSYAAALTSGYCYELVLSAIDNTNNVSATATSKPVLFDSTSALGLGGAATLTDNCAQIGSCYRTGNNIYFVPAAALTITLTSHGANNVSGISSSTFSALSNPTGWSYGYTPGTPVPGAAAQAQLTWSDLSTATTTLSVTETDGAGVRSSPPITITFIPDPGAKADFSAPVAGQTNYAKPGSFQVTWTETPGNFPVTNRSTQREIEPAGSAGNCPASSWAPDGQPISSTPPVAATLLAGNCYEWIETLTDVLGNHVFTSAPVFVDNTLPTIGLSSPLANTPLSGTVAITGTATDDARLVSWALSYGAGTSPTGWTPIGTPGTSPVVAGGFLGSWVTGSLPSGIYTLQLTAVDAAGNAPLPATVLVYIDNTNRGDESYYTSVPLDMGGGLKLGVSVATGEAAISRTLFDISSYGPDQSLSLSFNSGQGSAAGMFGTGWSSNLTQYLDLSNAGTSGGFIIWHEADGGQVPFGSSDGITWTALAGHFEILTIPTAGTYSITEPDHSSYTFAGSADSTARVTAITDANGNAMSLSWPNGAGTATAKDAGGRITSMTVNSAGQITDVTSSAESSQSHWVFGYSGASLTTIPDPLGNVTTFTPHAAASCPTESYAGACLLVSRPLTVLNPDGTSSPKTANWTIEYDSSGRVVGVVDPNEASAGVSDTFRYNANGAGDTVVSLARDASQRNVTTYSFVPLDNTNPDERGYVYSILDPEGWTTKYTYDSRGNVLTQARQIDHSGNWATTTYANYDAYGYAWTETDPIGIKTSYTYSVDGYHDLTDKIVSGGTGSGKLTRETEYTYTNHLLTSEIENPSGTSGPDVNVTTRYTYTTHDQVATETDPLGYVTAYVYDQTSGDKIAMVANCVAYDAQAGKCGGTPDDTTDVTTSYTYDLDGTPKAETDPIAAAYVDSTGAHVAAKTETTTYVYDAMGNQLIEIKPGDNGDSAALDRQTVSTYDSFGDQTSSLSQVRTAGTQSWTGIDNSITTSDLLGRAATVTDTNTTATTSKVTTYDLAGDVVLVSSQGTSSAGVVTASATTRICDGLGRVEVEHEAGQADTQYTYDGLDDVIQTVSPAGSATIDTFDFDGHPLTDTANHDSTQPSNSNGGVNALTTHHHDTLGREDSKTDPSGLHAVTHYDALGRVVSTVSTDPSTTPATVTETDTSYDLAGNVLSTTSAHAQGTSGGTVTTSTYDALGREITTTKPDGTTGSPVTIASYYDSAGDAVATVAPSVMDPAKLVVNRTIYNVQGEAVTTIDNCTDSGTTASTDPGHCTAPLPAAKHDSVTNLVTTYSYSFDGTKISSDSVVGTTDTRATYDGAGRVLSSTVDPVTGGLNLVTTYTYDSAGRQKTQTSPLGVVQDTIYNTSGKVCRVIVDSTIVDPWTSLSSPCASPLGAAKTGTANLDTTFAYDDAGRKQSQTDPNGTLTSYTYDTAGYLRRQDVTQLGASSPITTLYYYNASGQDLATATSNDDGTAAITRYVYDGAGHLTEQIDNCIDSGTTDPASCTGTAGSAGTVNVIKIYTYDAAGNKTSMTAPSPVGGTATVTTLYAYDATSHLCRVVEAATLSLATLGALTTPCSSALPDLTPISATQNVDTQYTYDTAGNMARQIVPADTLQPNPPASYTTTTTTYKYDEEGRLISETDPDGNVSGSNPVSHTTTYTYDINGNRATEIQPDGQTIAWYYDAANRLCQQAAGTSLTTPTHPCTDKVEGATVDTIYSRDKAGNMLSATDPLNPLGAQTISATYDAQNRPLNVSSTDGPTMPASPTDQTTYTYPDTATQTRTDPTGFYSFTIDGLGREKSMADPLNTSGSHYSWTYGLSGQTKSVSDPTGIFTCYGHDPLGHRTSTSTATSLTPTGDCANPVSLYDYAYNAAGNETSVNVNVGADPTNGTTNYSYDPLGRLSGYTLPASSPLAASSQTYGWNSMPDRASVTTGATTPVTTTTYFDAAGRPLSDTAGSGNTYGSNGNGQITSTPANTTTSTAGETLKYDDLGRLSEVDIAAYANKPSSTETYAYDPLGRLQTVSTGVTTRFIYVGLTDSVAEEVDGNGNVISEHATDLSGTELFDFTGITGNTVTYLGRNAHGDVTYTYNQAGTVTSTAAYDPFGNVIATSGSRPSMTDSGWQGTWFDGLTHLYYVNARWYSSTLGEFLSNDPLSGDVTNPQSRDPYAFCSGDAVDETDVSGQAGNPIGVPFFSQKNSLWAGLPMDPGGPCKDTFTQSGCAVTSAAMVLKYYKVNVSVTIPPAYGAGTSSGMSPWYLGLWLAHKGLIDAACYITWHSGIWADKPSPDATWSVHYFKSPTSATTYDAVPPSDKNLIASELSHGRPLIAQLTAKGIPTHFVVITGTHGKDYIINDPAKFAAGTYGSGPYFFTSGYHMDYLVTFRFAP